MTLPLRYEVEASLLADGRAEATARGEHILFDASSEPGTLPDPAHLLAAAFAGCLLKSVERSATCLRFCYTAASVRVVAERHGSPPSFSRIAYELELETAEPSGRVDLLHRSLLKFGPVTSTLDRVCEIEGRVVVREPVPA